MHPSLRLHRRSEPPKTPRRHRHQWTRTVLPRRNSHQRGQSTPPHPPHPCCGVHSPAPVCPCASLSCCLRLRSWPRPRSLRWPSPVPSCRSVTSHHHRSCPPHGSQTAKAGSDTSCVEDAGLPRSMLPASGRTWLAIPETYNDLFAQPPERRARLHTDTKNVTP